MTKIIGLNHDNNRKKINEMNQLILGFLVVRNHMELKNDHWNISDNNNSIW